MRFFFAAVVTIASFAFASLCGAAEIKVLSAGAFKAVAVEVAADFEKRTGHKVTVDNATAGVLQQRISKGEAFDLAIITPGALKTLAQEGRMVGASVVDVAKVGIGVAVREGDPSPDLSSVETFKAALLAARRVAYIDPAAGGSSGIYLSRWFERAGIADQIKSKAVLVPGGLVAERLVTGEADLALHQISEIIGVKGARLVGPLPAEIQNFTVYTAGLSTASSNADAAWAFLIELAKSEGAKRALDKRGMTAP